MGTAPHTEGTGGDKAERDDELQVLLADYQSLRDDERTTIASQGVAVTIAIALLGGLVAFAGQSCTLTANHQGCADIPNVFLAIAPAVPFAALGFIMLQGIVSVVRSYYIRILELEIQGRIPVRFGLLEKLGPASYIGLTTEVLSLRRGRWSYRALTGVILFVAGLTFGGITVYIAIHMSMTTRLLMLSLYGAAAMLVLYEAYIMIVRGRQLFIQVVNGYVNHKEQLLVLAKPRIAGQRSMRSYLFLPRFETIPKSLFALVAFCATASATGFWQWKRFLLLWIILEYFLYSARYQWNDLRDLEVDRRHPSWDIRGRLPSGRDSRETTHNVSLSIIALVLRLAAAAFIGYATHTLVQVGLLAGAVFAIGICYELVRARLPIATLFSGRHNRILSAIIWIALGPGYAVRGAVGFLTAGLSWTSSALYLGLSALMSIGIMGALLSWLLDTSSYFLVSPNGTWYVKPNQSIRRPYLWILVQYAPVPISTSQGELSSGGKAREAKQERFLRNASAGWAPWNVALVFAYVLTAEFCISLTNGRAVTATSYWMIGAVMISGAVLMVYCSRQWQRFVVAGLFAGLVTFISFSNHSPEWPLIGIGWLAISAFYISFCGMTFLDMMQTLSGLRKLLIKSGLSLFKIMFGSAAMRYLRP
jgi:4-hydroxybenzoate polyprenyltransferase